MDGEQIIDGAEAATVGAAAGPQELPPQDTTTEPPKKRRGRPPGSGTKSAEQIEAGTAAGKTEAKPGARKGKVSFDKSQLEMMGKQLAGVHLIAAQVTGIQELCITQEEGVALAAGIAGVCEQYNLAIDGKTGAALQLVLTAAMVYGPRALAVRARAAQAAANDESRTVPAAA